MRKPILAATLVALAVPAIVPALSSAAPPTGKTVTIMTHSAQHLDTTDATTNTPSPYGYVWATDNLSLRYDVTPTGVNQWQVAILAQGSFAGVANPTTGAPDINNGSVTGTITYDVSSPNAPDKSAVPAQESGPSIRDAIRQMFHLADDSAISGGDHYSFTYNKVDGAAYTQSA
jgi:hypothetical protein